MNLNFLHSSILWVIISLPSSQTRLLNLNSVLIDSKLLRMSDSSVFITMANDTNPILTAINSLPFETDSDKAFVMMEALKAHALLTQSILQAFLTLAGIQFTSFWISNQIHIPNAFPALLLEMSNVVPANTIASIKPEVVLPMLAVLDEGEGVQPQVAGDEWGQKMMDVQSAWSQNKKGQGVRVMVLDTGVRGTHQEFTGKQILWKDAVANTLTPSDLNGHGTHVCGTIAGNTVGIAPAATLQACQCCSSAGCPQNALTSCGQWASCPDPATGCLKKPHIVSCSWGGTGGNTFYQSCVNAWQTAGITPIFALGNSGPKCSTAGSPGDYSNVCGVGAIDENKNVASFSSRGPTVTGSQTKPQVSAPGVAINSCSHVADDQYRKLSGTSMATPHMSGMAAVLQSNGNIMSYKNLMNTLINSCSEDLTSSGETCGNTRDSEFPNNIYGNGRPTCGTALRNMKLEQQKIEGENTNSFDDFDTEDTEDENNAAEENDFETDDD